MISKMYEYDLGKDRYHGEGIPRVSRDGVHEIKNRVTETSNQ